MNKTPNFLEAENLTVVYPTGDVALQDVTFSIPGTTFMAIIGPNGSGKSTLLKTMLGLLKPTQGYIKVWGYDARRKYKTIRHMVRYVPQRDHIQHTIPMKVKDIVLMGRLLKKPPPRFASGKDIAAAKDALHRVAMDDLWNQPFPDLSGGQRQRVLVARALASEGRIMMLDEPLLGADHDSQLHIVDALQEYYNQNQVSIIMVTHDLNPIHMIVKDVLMLNRELVGIGQPCAIMDPELIKQVYGPSAKIVEMDGHRFCITHDSGVDRHDH
ncbi:MAG: metal ABC transporter ATP-binding protein [Candidatus Hermodarchaeota archaeon]|jgi:zinc/manganese transport system ATP-binding protein|nr:metal ABC transporter ATP-binding protein [Candidatus Hermodarchaeota archaeon]